jgi:amino acid adenylation domain-containing protein
MLAESDNAILESSVFVPQSHLKEIEKQLREAIASFFHSQTPPRIHSNHSNLSVINPNPRFVKDPTLLHHLIPKTGDNVALEFTSHNGQKIYLKYSELDRQSTGMARSISDCGNMLESPSQPIIPLLIPQSPELYVTLLAVLKAGCAFCPLPFDAPPDRLRFVIGDMSARLLLTVSSMLDKVSKIEGVMIFCVDKLPNSANKISTPKLRPVFPNNLAYVMYTSGSTGKPKGVPISHTAVTQSLLAHDRHIPHFSRFLQFATPTFDVSMFEIFFTLYRRSTLVACQRENLLDDLPGMMRNLNVDAAELTPTVAGGLLKKRHLVPNLNILLTIGEMLTPQVVQEFGGDENKESILWAMYGPTEAAIHCTLQPAFKSNFKVGNIGFPLDTVSAFIVSAHSENRENDEIEVLPVGHVGELAVGGHQLAECYLNRPEQTAKAFINDRTYGRLYLTGDKARMLPDGTLECLGRISSGQIKLRGQRIELGEVEAAALKASACNGAAAFVIHNTLVLFCHGNGDEISPEHVTNACRQWLPGYMVPSDVVIVQELPLLASGKVDRKQLEIQYEHFLDSLQTSSQSSDILTLKVCDIVSSIVGRPVKPEDQLIATGLDSLLAIQAATHFRQNGLQISTVDVLTAITVNDLCSSLETRHSAEEHANLHNNGSEDNFAEIKTNILNSQGFWLRRTDIQEIVPCTPLQISMLAETTKDPRTYYNWIEFAFCQPYSFEEIKKWITDLCAKNEILRSGFAELTRADYPFAQIIWNSLDSTQISKVHLFEKSADISKQFTFARPIQFQILCGKSESRVLIQLHHALYDGWSVDHICHDLAQMSVGNEIQIRPQFREVANFYHMLSNGETQSYWQEQLADFNPKALPSCNKQDFQANTKSSNVRSMFIALPKLRHSARSVCVSPQAFFQAALACTLTSYLDTTDILFATVTSGRTLAIPRMEDIIGPCIVTLPLRVNISHAFRVRNLLSLVHDQNRAMLQHCTLSFREIKKACGFDASASLSDVLFIWQETLQSRVGDEVEQCVRLVDQSDHLEFKLVLEIEPHGNGLSAKATYQCETFTESEIDVLLQRIDELVAKFEEDSNAPLRSACHEILPEVPFTGNQQPNFVTSSRNLASTIDPSLGSKIPAAKPIHQNRATAVSNQQFNLKANKEPDKPKDLSDWTEIEKKLSALFAEIVGISLTSIKRHNSLFAFGLDSISAIPFSKLIRDHTLCNVTVSTVLQNPTIARLASRIKSLEPTRFSTGDSLKVFTNDSIRRIKTCLGKRADKLFKILPCTPLQEAMLSASHSNDSDVYCNLMEFKIHAGTQKLKRCWEQMVKRQEILRTCFVATEQADFPFAQVVLSEHHGYWKEVFIKSEETDCLSHTAQSNQRIISYLDATEPPYDLELVESSRHTLLRFASHHALYDASAMAQLLLEVEQHYNGIELLTPVPYEPFLNMMISMRSNHALDFWCSKLDGFQPLFLTPPVSRRQISTTYTLAHSFSDIEAAARSLHVSLMILLQAAWTKVLHSMFDKDDVCFGNIFSGRTLPLENIHKLIAPTFNTLPVRIDVSRCRTNSALLSSLQNFNNDALDFQLVPLRAIQNRLRMGGTGIFPTLFLLQHSSYELDSQIWTLERDMGNMNVSLIPNLFVRKIDDVPSTANTLHEMGVPTLTLASQPLRQGPPRLVM